MDQVPELMSQTSLLGKFSSPFESTHIYFVPLGGKLSQKFSQILTKQSCLLSLWQFAAKCYLWDHAVSHGKVPPSQWGRGNHLRFQVPSWWTTWRATCQSLFACLAESQPHQLGLLYRIQLTLGAADLWTTRVAEENKKNLAHVLFMIGAEYSDLWTYFLPNVSVLLCGYLAVLCCMSKILNIKSEREHWETVVPIACGDSFWDFRWLFGTVSYTAMKLLSLHVW